jgi:hypothetical protein
MQLEEMKPAIVSGSVLSAAAIALSVNVISISGWLLLVGLALLPPLLLARMWSQPVPTASKSVV